MQESAADVHVIPMNKAEARAAVDAIRKNLDTAGKLALGLCHREGWKALGYASWAGCAEGEFGCGVRRIQQMMAAEELRSFITNHGSQKLNENIPERVIRPLTSLRDEPELIPEAWNLAKEQSDGKPTQEDVRRAVDVVLERNGLLAPSIPATSPSRPKATGYDVIKRCVDDFLVVVGSVNAPDTPEQRGWGGFPVVAGRFTTLERRQIRNYLQSLVESVQDWLQELEGT